MAFEGTKVHQNTLRAIRKRTPALMKAIERYNKLCDRLATLRPGDSLFPLPQKLPFENGKLLEDETLLQDVWLQNTPGEAFPWLTDASVRRGIRALQVVDRCEEEDRRLQREATNCYRWFQREAHAVEIGLRNTIGAFLTRVSERAQRYQTRTCM